LDGDLDGELLGLADGFLEGFFEGSSDGDREGVNTVGSADGLELGFVDGPADGANVGKLVQFWHSTHNGPKGAVTKAGSVWTGQPLPENMSFTLMAIAK
jgi:hypothetical protein